MAGKRTWVLLADGARARIIESEGRGSELKAVYEEEDVRARLPAREIDADRPGRAFDSGGRGDAAAQGRHAFETEVDPQRKEKADFMRGVAEILEEGARKRSYERLVIIAAPKALGDLRSFLSKNVSNLVSDEIPKDLVDVPLHALPERLGDLIKS